MNLYYHNNRYGRLFPWCLTPLSSIILLYRGGKPDTITYQMA